MSTTPILIPNIVVELSFDQLVAAAQQLGSEEKKELIRAIALVDLDAELMRLIDELTAQPPVDDITDEEIMAEIRAVRQSRPH